MKVLFVATCSPIVRDPKKSRAFYEGLGIGFDENAGDYVFTHELPGAKHFGLWPLHEAAQACFGKDEWPADLAVPQAALELEVDDVKAAAAELEGTGHSLVHPARTEPWGQEIARLLSPDGLLVGVCHTPWLHDKKS